MLKKAQKKGINSNSSTKGKETGTGTDFSILNELIGFEVRRAQQKIFQHFQGSVGNLNITPGQAGVLILIHNNPAISQSALARAIGVERATLGETIDYLVEKKWVERRKAAADKRSYALFLTNDGKQFIRKLLTAIHQHEKNVSENLTKKEYRELLQLLIKFNDGYRVD